MKLVTKEIKNQLAKYPLYSQSEKGKDAICAAKFFLCGGAHTWYVLEADLKENIAYGITVNGYGECEYGYFSLTELQSLRNRWGCGVERDTCHKPTPICDMKNEGYLAKFINKLYSEAEA
ncbi:MAG: DUF2958 domain-containing protein [Bacteroidaceae bacterium]|nr:DUF2958 domain-containing protein [Bacteroidaceae bacterium]